MIEFIYNPNRIAQNQLLGAKQSMFLLNPIFTKPSNKGLSNVNNISKMGLSGIKFKSKSAIVSLLRIKLDLKYHNASKQLYRKVRVGLMYLLMFLIDLKLLKLVKIIFSS